MKILKVGILGCGSRGCETYGRLIYPLKDQFEIVTLCDIRQDRLDKYSKEFKISKDNLFKDEDEFFKEKRADVLFICTLDKDHVRQAIKALNLGYHLLLEKPISSDINELEALLEAKERSGKEVIVCHVLRYAKAFLKVNELINKGIIGSLVHIQALEQVGWYHQAHSFVRGNWHNTIDTAPMIMAKCCHDLDLLQFYAKSKADSVSSIGDLRFFNKEHKPQGASNRCLECQYVDTCPYSAKVIYIDGWYKRGKPVNEWPFNVVTESNPLTEESIYDGIKNTDYGKCVFECDNNAVDNEVSMIKFQNGVTASLTMMGFTGQIGRIMKFYGTYGEIDLDEEKGIIEIKRFSKDVEIIKIIDLTEASGMAHGGGDYMIVSSLYDAITKGNSSTKLEDSIESHLMAIKLEESRLQGGKLIKVHNA